MHSIFYRHAKSNDALGRTWKSKQGFQALTSKIAGLPIKQDVYGASWEKANAFSVSTKPPLAIPHRCQSPPA